MNRYVKVKGHNNWFLVLEPNQTEPNQLSETMQQKIVLSEFQTIHNKDIRLDFSHRLTLAATYELDYEKIASKYNKTLLIRPSGSYMYLYDNEIIAETYDNMFPIDDFADIVICENDSHAPHNWISYLKNIFPNKKITTINFFFLRSDEEIEKYFSKAKFITFSTTFSNYDWYNKLLKHINAHHHIIGNCSDNEKWNDDIHSNQKIEIIRNLN